MNSRNALSATPNRRINTDAQTAALRLLLAGGLSRTLDVTKEAGVELNHLGVLRIDEVTG